MPAAQLKPVLMQMGMSPNMADLLLEMAEGLNSGPYEDARTAISREHDSYYSRNFRSRSICAGISRKGIRRVVIRSRIFASFVLTRFIYRLFELPA